jgi:hypothetical protein
MVEYIKVQDHKNLLRQKNSKGVVNCDLDELNKYKLEREYKYLQSVKRYPRFNRKLNNFLFFTSSTITS